jgi:hypothetical protein
MLNDKDIKECRHLRKCLQSGIVLTDRIDKFLERVESTEAATGALPKPGKQKEKRKQKYMKFLLNSNLG